MVDLVLGSRGLILEVELLVPLSNELLLMGFNQGLESLLRFELFVSPSPVENRAVALLLPPTLLESVHEGASLFETGEVGLTEILGSCLIQNMQCSPL